MADGLDKYLDKFAPKKPKAAGDDSVARVLDDEFAKLGYGDTARLSILGDVGRENAWNRQTIFGGHNDPKNNARNRGIISWQGDRSKKLDDHLKKEGVYGRGDDEELRGMARFMDSELKTDFPDVHKSLMNAKGTYDASEALRKYIKYVPNAPYNTPDDEFRVKNNADWAKRAKSLGLAQKGLDDYLDRMKSGTSKDPLDAYLDQIGGQPTPTNPTQQPLTTGLKPLLQPGQPLAQETAEMPITVPDQLPVTSPVTNQPKQALPTAKTPILSNIRKPQAPVQSEYTPSVDSYIPPTAPPIEPDDNSSRVIADDFKRPVSFREKPADVPNREWVVQQLVPEIVAKTGYEAIDVEKQLRQGFQNEYGTPLDKIGRDGTWTFEMTPDFADAVVARGEGKRNALANVIATGQDLSDEDKAKLSTSLGLDPAEIDTALAGQGGWRYQDAVTQGAANKQFYAAKQAEYAASLAQGEPASIAQIRAAADVGWLTKAEADKAIAKEQEIAKNLLAENRISAKLDLSGVGQARMGTGALGSGPVETQSDYAALNDILKKYGTLANYEKEQKDLVEKYGYLYAKRPLAPALEFAKRFGNAVPQAVSSILETIAIAGEMSTVLPTGAVDYLAGTDLQKQLSAENSPLYKIGKDFGAYFDDLKNKDFDDNKLISIVPDTLGQIVVQILAGVATGGASLPTAIGAAMGASQQYEDAAKFTQDPTARLVAASVGAAAAIPDAIIFNKWFKSLGQGETQGFLNNFAKSIFAPLGLRFGDAAAEEMTRVTMKTWANNLIKGSLFEGAQEVSENKINDALALAVYDRSEARKKKLLSINQEDIASFIGGLVGGFGGGVVETRIEQVNEQKIEDALTYLPDLVAAGKITAAQAAAAEPVLQEELQQRKKGSPRVREVVQLQPIEGTKVNQEPAKASLTPESKPADSLDTYIDQIKEQTVEETPSEVPAQPAQMGEKPLVSDTVPEDKTKPGKRKPIKDRGPAEESRPTLADEQRAGMVYGQTKDLYDEIRTINQEIQSIENQFPATPEDEGSVDTDSMIKRIDELKARRNQISDEIDRVTNNISAPATDKTATDGSPSANAAEVPQDAIAAESSPEKPTAQPKAAEPTKPRPPITVKRLQLTARVPQEKIALTEEAAKDETFEPSEQQQAAGQKLFELFQAQEAEPDNKTARDKFNRALSKASVGETLAFEGLRNEKPQITEVKSADLDTEGRRMSAEARRLNAAKDLSVGDRVTLSDGTSVGTVKGVNENGFISYHVDGQPESQIVSGVEADRVTRQDYNPGKEMASAINMDAITPENIDQIAAMFEKKPEKSSEDAKKVYKSIEDAPDYGVYSKYFPSDGTTWYGFKNPNGAADGKGNVLTLTADEARADADKARQSAERSKQAETEQATPKPTNAFTEAMSPMQRGKAEKALSKVWNVNGKHLTTKEYVDQKFKDGTLELDSYEENRIKDMTRRQYNRATNEQQAAHEKKVREGGKVTKYLVNGLDLGKIAYDYAQHLSASAENKADKPTIKEIADASPNISIVRPDRPTININVVGADGLTDAERGGPIAAAKPEEVIPHDGWRGNLIKSRDYANRLGIRDQIKKSATADEELENLTTAIDDYLSLKGHIRSSVKADGKMPSWDEVMKDFRTEGVESNVVPYDKRFPVVQQDKYRAKEVDGLTVRDEIPNQDSIGATFNDYTVLKKIREVSMSEFDAKPNPNERTKALAQEIKESGEINPLIVALDDSNEPYILEGQHRFEALIELGVQSFPAMVVIDLDNPPPLDPARPFSATEVEVLQKAYDDAKLLYGVPEKKKETASNDGRKTEPTVKSADDLFDAQFAILKAEEEAKKKNDDDDGGWGNLDAALGLKSVLPEEEQPFYASQYKTFKPIFEDIVSRFDTKDPGEQMLTFLRKMNERYDLDVIAKLKPYVVKFFDENVLAAPVAGVAAKPDMEGLSKAFAKAFSEGKRKFATIVEARKFAEEILGEPVKAGTELAKTVDEAIEVGIVLTARDVVNARRLGNFQSDEQVFERLVQLYDQQPSLNVRTSTSVREQAYSTPAPLAYIASQLAGVEFGKSVFEPTAGNGMLLMEAPDTDNTIANELNPDRYASLKLLLPNAFVSNQDATSTFDEDQVDVVIGNPPFGVVKNDAGQSVEFQVNDKYSTTEIDHKIVFESLKWMKPDGRAVFIIGGVNAQTDEAKSDKYNGAAKRKFFYSLFQEYNVVDHFTVDGKLYAKQGASYPVDVLVIDGKGKSSLKLPAASLPRVYDSWEGLKELLTNEPRTSGAKANQEVSGSMDAGTRKSPNSRSNRGSLKSGANTNAVSDVPSGQSSTDVERGTRSADGTRKSDGSAQTKQSVEPRDFSDSADLGGRDVSVKPATSGETVESRDNLEPAEEANADEQTGGKDRAANEPRKLDDSDTRVRKPRKALDSETASATGQVPYEPQSNGKAMQTLVPTNLYSAVVNSLETLEEKVGPVDDYVARKLGYKDAADVHNFFAGEQLDALGLALYNMENGAGFIIGDQTGIGKGRVVAGVLKYAMESGQIPIFVTEKPNLYKDMLRDLEDIGVKDVRPLLTNGGASVPLDDDQTVFLKTPAVAKHNVALQAMTDAGELHPDYNIIFTSYNQMQAVNQAETPRREFLREMARRGIIVFDESHNAGGSGDDNKIPKLGAAPDRSDFARELVDAANGVFYSSATYAKRPGVMSLYSKTDMRFAVPKSGTLADAINAGGVPLQQVVAAMLAESGQYIRRERDFTGINYDTVSIPVDHAKAEQVSAIMLAIKEFDDAKQGGLEQIKKDLKAEAGAIQANSAVGAPGASSTNFTSLMHNLIDQMLIILKLDGSVDQAIKALKNDEKVILTVKNTNGSFIGDYVKENGLVPGDAIGLNFGDMLQKYLEASRNVTIGKGFGPKITRRLEDEELGPRGLKAYEDALAKIRQADWTGMPVSPIDYMIHKIEQAGYKVGEVTGRTEQVRYNADGTAVYQRRSDKEIKTAGRLAVINAFNGGKADKPFAKEKTLDVVVLNQAGSTGLSMHASSTFGDQRKRALMVVQAEGNIDTHMQILGRPNRTGQVVKPRYEQHVADIPAELRPAAVLATKMASLNANTTASRDSAVTAKDVLDFINIYGDEVVANLMDENPEIHRKVGEPLKPGLVGLEREGAARKVTGRIPLLPLKEQEQLYAQIAEEYTSHIERLNQIGENKLEAETLPLDAVTLSRTEVFEGQGREPFKQGAWAEQVEVKKLGKPFSSEQLLTTLRDVTNAGENADLPAIQSAGATAARETIVEFQKEAAAYIEKELDKLTDPDKIRAQRVRLEGIRDRVVTAMRAAPAGAAVNVRTMYGDVRGIVGGMRRKTVTKNPLALSNFEFTIYVADSTRQLKIPASKLYTEFNAPTGDAAAGNIFVLRPLSRNDDILGRFDNAQLTRTEQRTIITGNLLAGFAQFKQGRIINFTTKEGDIRQGILMPASFDVVKALSDQPVEFANTDQIMQFLAPGGRILQDANTGDMRVTNYNGNYSFSVPASKAKGGAFYLNRGITNAAGTDFVKSGSSMTLRVDKETARDVIDEMRGQGIALVATTFKDAAREITGETVAKPEAAEQPRPLKSVLATEPAQNPFYSQLERTVEAKMPAKASADQVRGIIKDTKAEEREWLGIDEFLDSKPTFTKDEVLAFVRENNVDVQEVVKGEAGWVGDDLMTADGYRAANLVENDDGTWTYLSDYSDGSDSFDTRAEAQREAEATTIEDPFGNTGQTKYGTYTLPGGDNYKELLITMPVENRQTGWRYIPRNGGVGFTMKMGDSPETRDARAQANNADVEPIFEDVADFKSGHFEEPNILAHLRFDERTVDGKKTLHISELQSDWHQTGRKKGYKTKHARNVAIIPNEGGAGFVVQRDGMAVWAGLDRHAAEAVADRERQEGGNYVPDAPFKKSWHELGFKKALRFAVENDFDAVSWDTGATQADRYDLSKHISEIHYSGSNLKAYGLNGETVMERTGVKEDDLPDIIGKDATQRLLDQKPQGTLRSLIGEDLKVGGEGMSGFYDTILPKFVGKYVKKWGGRVERGSVIGGDASGIEVDDYFVDTDLDSDPFDENPTYTVYHEGGEEIASGFETAEAAQSYIRSGLGDYKSIPVHSVTITPDMKASVMQGQPLFNKLDAAADSEKMTVEEMKDLPYEPIESILAGAEMSRTGDLLKMNAKSHELMRRTFEEHRWREAQKQGKTLKPSDYEDLFGGVFLEPNVVSNTIAVLRDKATEAAELGYTKEEVATFADHADMLAAAAKEGNGTAVMFILDRNLPGELFHQADYLGAAEKTLLDRHDGKAKAALDAHKVRQILWDKHYGKYNEYKRYRSQKLLNAVLRAEIPTYLIESSDESLEAMGITPEMVDDYMLTWFEGYAAKNGVDALDNFDKEELDVQDFITQIKESFRQETRPDGEGNESSSREKQPTGPARGDPQPDQRNQEAPQAESGPDRRYASGLGDGLTDGVHLTAETHMGRRIEKREIEKEMGLGADERLRSLPLTLRRAGIDAVDLAYEVFKDGPAIEAATALLEQHGVNGSVELLRNLPAKALDAEHGILSFMLMRTLQDHAASLRETNPEEAKKAFELSLELGREHAIAATQLGRFTRVPSIIGGAVENLMYAVQGIIEEKAPGKTLSAEQWERVEGIGRDLEAAIAKINALQKENRNKQAQIKRLKDKEAGKKPKRSKSTVTRKTIVKLIKADNEKSSVTEDGKARLKAKWLGGGPLKSVLGKDSQTDSAAFKKWFKDSKVVDENGKPLIVFHGGAANITEFDANKAGTVNISDWGKGIYFTPQRWMADGYREDAVLKADVEGDRLYKAMEKRAEELGTTPLDAAIDLGFQSPEYNEISALRQKWVKHREGVRKNEEGGDVYPVYVKLTNPLIHRYGEMTDPFLADYAREGGHDGILIIEKNGQIGEVIAFEPTQIKSAIGNNGNFDENSPSILKSVLPEDDRLDAEDLNDFANVGAMMLIEGLAGETEYLPSDFKAELLSEFGSGVEPYFDEIYKAAWDRRTEWLNDLRYQQTKERVQNKYAEGEDLEDWEIEEILGTEKMKAKRRRFIERYHEITVGAKKPKKNLGAYKAIIADLTQDESDAVALGALVHAEGLGPAEMYKRLIALGVTDEAEQRNAIRKGADIWQKAKLVFRDQQEEVANEILEAEGEQKKIDELLWEARRELEKSQAAVADEMRRIKNGEGWYHLNQLANMLNASRTLMASFDMSGALRQGGFFTIASPENQRKAITNMFKSIREKGFGAAIMELERSGNFTLSQRAGLDYAIAGKTDESSLLGEELFKGDKTIEHLPVIGKILSEGIVKWSERTYTAVLDTQRYVMFDIFAKELAGRGLTFRQNPDEFKKIAEFINIATGRGVMPSNKFAKILMDLPLFAPRYTLSRLQLLNVTLNPVAYANMPPAARKIVARNAVRFYGTTMGVLGLVSMFGAAIGASVNWDDDDDDFLKIKIGSSKYDIFAGTLQPAKLIIKVVHSAIRTKGGFENRLPGEFGNDTINAVGRFVRGKLSPMASLATDYALGSDYVGDEFKWSKAVSSRLMPLVFNEIRESYKADGVVGIARAVPPSFLGVGVSTYKDRPERPETEAEKFAGKAAVWSFKNDKPQTAEEKQKQAIVQALRARSRAGEDVTAEIDQQIAAGNVTKLQKGTILSAATESYLVDRTEGLSLENAETVFKLATPSERIDLLPLINKKMKTASIKGNLTAEQRGRLESLGVKIPGEVPMPEAVQREFDAFEIPIPDVGEKLTLKKGADQTKLTSEQYDKYRKETLTRIYAGVEEIIRDPSYRNASDADKERLLKRVISKQRAREQKETKAEIMQ